AGTSSIYVGASTLFDFSGVSGGSLTLGSGRTLFGNGGVQGAFTLGSGATLAPGSNAVGRLMVYNSLALAAGSSSVFELRKAPLTNDAVVVLGALSNGGTLIVTNIAGPALAAGDSFQLFIAG